MRILLTGCCGFIGWKTCEFLLKEGHTVIGIDNLNDYYDVRLKLWRLNSLRQLALNRQNLFSFYKINIENYESLKNLFSIFKPDRPDRPFDAVINLAARAGVRYSIINPHVYYTTNVLGNLNLLELSREYGVKKYVFASTSSLYAGQKMPFKESLPVNEPISPYAASKKAAEVMCYTYHKLFGIDVTILRYFTVYGPAGRPDMSIFRFISWIDKGEPVIMYGDGKQMRDFTFVDDIARGTIAGLMPLGFEIINLGNEHPHTMIEAVKIIHSELNKPSVPCVCSDVKPNKPDRPNKPNKPDKPDRPKRPNKPEKLRVIYKPFHIADVQATWADITKAKKLLKWQPEYKFAQGLAETVKWYKENRKLVQKIKIDMSK